MKENQVLLNWFRTLQVISTLTVKVRIEDIGENVECSVEDEGIGINPKT